MNSLTLLSITGTPKTPTVLCDPEAGKLVLQGNCIPEDGIVFFTPLKDWILSYVQAPQEKTEFNVHLNYFNTSSSRLLLNLFRMCMPLLEQGLEFNINWQFDEDDDDMREAGEDYALMIGDCFTMRSL